MEKGQGKGTDTLQTDNVFARKEYIEREAALSAQNKSMNLAECRKRLERLPAADVVPLVRCGECKLYCGRLWENGKTGICARTDFGVKDTDFCSYGARMDGDGE